MRTSTTRFASRALANRKTHDYESLKREVQDTTTPDAAEWLALPDLSARLPESGHYWVEEEDIDEVRERFLKTGHQPKCVL